MLACPLATHPQRRDFRHADTCGAPDRKRYNAVQGVDEVVLISSPYPATEILHHHCLQIASIAVSRNSVLMAGIGKFLTSALTVHTEVQASLAAVNFDFALLKVEAPAEYAGVGESLTKLRKQNAEDGSSHITARKLAALFESEIPRTPKLFRAYGLRASEITSSPINNPKGTSEHGPFAAHVGVDGTSIWAAATSGKEAVALHLLACLLARIWAANEAASIWTELVKERRARLHDQIESGSSFHASSLYASRMEISRTQLTEWDASARLVYSA